MKLPQSSKLFFAVFLIVLLSDLPVFSQNYTTYVLNNEIGMVSNLVKSVAQDGDGFIWIASDAGLIRYDGKNFKSFTKNLPSFLIKDVRNIGDGKLCVVSDLGVGDLVKDGSGYSYRSIAYSTTRESDTSLYYPKSVYKDKSGCIWIGDLTGILSYKNGILKKYRFAKMYHVYGIFRSFLMTDDNRNNLIASTRKGYLFKFNRSADRFDLLPFKPPSAGFTIDALLNTGDGSLLIGTDSGVYRVTFNNDYTDCRTEKLVNLDQVSSVALQPDGTIFIGTWENGLYYGTYSGGKINAEPYLDLHFNSIKNLFIDRDNNLWVCSDDGVAIIKKTAFEVPSSASYPDLNLFVQEIHSASDGHIYFTDSNRLYRIDSTDKGFHEKIIFKPSGSNIQSFAVGKNGIWIGYGNNTIEYRDKKDMARRFLYKMTDDNSMALYTDDSDQLWAYLARSKRIVRFDRLFIPHYYDFNINDLVSINVIRKGRDGELYCGGTGIKSYLFKYDQRSDKFVNISPKIGEKDFSAPIQVFDLIAAGNNKIYLATNYGLLADSAHDLISSGFQRLLSGTITKAISIEENGAVWLGTEKGVILRVKNEELFFDKKDGLPNSSIVDRGLAADAEERLWAGTAGGIAYLNLHDLKLNATSIPLFTDVSLINENAEEKGYLPKQLFSGISLEVSFSSLEYPSNLTLYKYRVLGLDTSWSSPGLNSSINLYRLPAGKFTIEVRAKSPAKYWSTAAVYSFTVNAPWYLSTFMLFIYIFFFVILLFALISYIYKARIRKLMRRENDLARLVNERTEDLLLSKHKVETLLEESEKAKEQLERATDEKSKLLSVAAHDLKNPLQSILGFSTIIEEESKDPEISGMAGMIYRSSKEMVGQISEMLDAAAMESKNMVLDMRPVDINFLVSNIIKHHSPRAAQKNQQIISNLANGIVTLADDHWLSVAVDNLISNAIKYSPKGEKIFVSTLKEGEQILIKVKDRGTGLTEEDKKKLFGLYQRLSAKPTGGESSTGLGLSIVKEIVDKHKGKVWAESEYGSGAEFIISLPVISDARVKS